LEGFNLGTGPVPLKQGEDLVGRLLSQGNTSRSFLRLSGKQSKSNETIRSFDKF